MAKAKDKREEYREAGEAAEKARKARTERLANLSPGAAEKLRAEMIADLLRVFEHPLNPYAGWAASRDRYRHLGHFPAVLVADLFGTHQEFQRAAGLIDSRGTSRHRLGIAHAHTEQRIAAYAKEHVLRWQGKYDRALRDRRGEKVVVVGSDLHSQFLDPFAWEVFIGVVRMVSPDVVVLNGDVVDFYVVSRHLKLPGEGHLTLQQEIDLTREKILRRVRESAPEATIVWHIGNHEYRLVRYLADTAPELASLDCLSFDKLFGVQEYEIEMQFGGSFLAPKASRQRKEVETNWRIYWDSYAVTHGTYTGEFPAARQLGRYGMSGTSGHVHTPQLYFDSTLRTPNVSWMSTGMLASYMVGKEYVPEPQRWTMGLGVATVLPARGIVVQQPVTIHDGYATFSGHVWQETPAAREARLAV